MGEQQNTPTMVPIAAARAMQWKVEFDRDLHSLKPGAQCEAVMKLGPQLVRWSQNCMVSASSANLSKLEPGQEHTFATAILLRLADTFRSGNNFIRICILKVLMLEFKERGRIGETFPVNISGRALVTKKWTSTGGPRARAMRVRRSGTEGLLTKKRVANHVEMLRRVKSVIDSGDPTSRALALRVLGCLADLGKDSVDVHNLVLQAVYSPHQQEVSAAFFAMGCLSEVSNEFSEHALEKAFVMVHAMETPLRVKVCAVRFFSKLGNSPALSLQAHEMGRRLMLRCPTHEIVTNMLTALTILAEESIVIIGRQVELLVTYASSDPRMNVRAVALKSLSKLLPQAVCCTSITDDIFKQVFSVVQDTVLPPALRVLAIQVIRKLFHQCFSTMNLEFMFQVMAWTELTTLFGVWPVTSQALLLLVDVVCWVTKFQKSVKTMKDSSEIHELSIRVCFLVCDQISITLALMTRSRSTDLKHSIIDDSVPAKTQIESMIKERVSFLCVLLVKLAEAYPLVSWYIVDSIAGTLENLAKENERLMKKRVDAEVPELEEDHGSKDVLKDGLPVPNKTTENAKLAAENQHSCTYDQVESMQAELGRCLSVCVSFLEYKKTTEDIHRRLHQLTEALVLVDVSSSSLYPVLGALMKARLVHESVISTCTVEELGPDLGRSAEGIKEFEKNNGSLGEESRKSLQRIAMKLIQGGKFWTVYKIGKDAAVSGFWRLAQSTLKPLVNKVSTEGCYFWLSALAHLAQAESLFQNSQDDNSICAVEVPCSMDQGSFEIEAKGTRDSMSGYDDDVPWDVGRQESVKVKTSYLGRYGKAAASALPLLRSSISSLSAGVCLERMFEFQRWVLTLRLELVESFSELVGLVTFISSFDTDAGLIDLEDTEKDNGMKSLDSALKASTEKVELLASRLKKLSEEYDLLSMSFMGIDQKSIGVISRASLLCSLITFCSLVIFSSRSTVFQGKPLPSSSVGTAALDLFHRLQQMEDGSWDNLLYFAIQSSPLAVHGRGLSRTFVSSPQNNALLKLSKWAIQSVLGIQHQLSMLGRVHRTRLLQQIIEECLQLPWLCPPFFFRTGPRTGVELFLAQAGPNTGESDELVVVQGSAMALSVCLQIANAPVESSSSLRKLVCALSFNPAGTMVELDEGVNVGSRTGSCGNQPLHPNIVDKLILHSNSLTEPLFQLGNSTITSHQSLSEGRTKLQPECFFCASVDGKGQGFASCTLDVSIAPCGDYELTLSCICVDNHSQICILPHLNTQPVFRIV